MEHTAGIGNAGGEEHARHRAVVMQVLRAALEAADPYMAVLKALEAYDLSNKLPHGNVYVLGAGKAGAAMACAVEEVLGDRITKGLVIVKDGHTGSVPLARVELAEACHPVPDRRGVEATERLLEIASQAGEDDIMLCLISGGGSALMQAPAEGVTLEDAQATTAALLRSGANINELNGVRKHLSRISGGQLARSTAPARVLSLILSDVTGSPLDVIASGPTAPDPTTYSGALDNLRRYDLLDKVPPSVLVRLRAGAHGDLPETPKPGDPLFKRVENSIVTSNVLAVEAAAKKAAGIGLNTLIISTYIEGEARKVGVVLAALAKEIISYGRPVPRPSCLLFGGETTVTVRGDGVGGRNTELALSAAIALDGLGSDVLVASLATDGGDGVSPSAGAIVDGTTVARGRVMGLDAQSALTNNDSYAYLAATGDALMLGPTGTNVNDVMAVFTF